jgi:hypothetical protein
MDVVLMRPDVAVAVTGPLAVSSVAARLTIESVEAMMASTAAHRVLYADGSSISLTLVKPDIPPPDEATRAHIRSVNLLPNVARLVRRDRRAWLLGRDDARRAGGPLARVVAGSARRAVGRVASPSWPSAFAGSISTRSRGRSRRFVPSTSAPPAEASEERARRRR